MIRERVTVEPAPAVAASGTAGGSWMPTDQTPGAACNGPVVGYAVVRGESAYTDGSGLAGSVSVETRCGTTSGSLASGFALTSTRTIGPLADLPRYSYTGSETTEILRVPLHQLDDVLSITLHMPAAGFPRPYDDFFRYGCRTSNAEAEEICVQSSAHAIKGGNLKTTFEIEGRARWLQQAWPDSVACGTETALPVLATKEGGVEGYVELGAGLMSVMRTGSGGLSVAGQYVPGATTTNNNAKPIWYPDARDGGVVYTALPCEHVSAPYTATVRMRGPGTNGFYQGESIRVLPPPPTALRLTPSRDTVEVGGYIWSLVRATAVLSDGTEAYLDADEPITFSMSGPPGALRTYPNAPDGSPVFTQTATLLYDESVNGSRRAHSDGVVFQLTPEDRAAPPTCDTDVVVSASGGGVSGETTVVVRGSSTAVNPTNLIVKVDPDVVAPGGTAAVRAEAVTTDGCDVGDDVISAVTSMKVTLSADVGVLIYGGQQGLELTVPYGALRGGRSPFERLLL